MVTELWDDGSGLAPGTALTRVSLGQATSRRSAEEPEPLHVLGSGPCASLNPDTRRNP